MQHQWDKQAAHSCIYTSAKRRGRTEADATGDNKGTQNSSSDEVNTELVSGNSSSSSSEPQGRIRRQPGWMRGYVTGEEFSEDEEIQSMVMYTEAGDPSTYEEAARCSKWRKAMECEIQAIERNETWSLTSLPAGARAIGVKWIYKTKLNERGEVDKHKARLVALRYAQKHGIDYTEVFASVARWDTIRMISLWQLKMVGMYIN